MDIKVYFFNKHVHKSCFLQLTKAKLFQIPQHAIQKILSAPSPSESDVFRVDFRSSHVHYLNDLEKDAMYRRWRSNINEVWFFLFFVE